MEFKDCISKNDMSKTFIDYEAPIIVIEEVIVENGFAQSRPGDRDPLEPGWD